MFELCSHVNIAVSTRMAFLNISYLLMEQIDHSYKQINQYLHAVQMQYVYSQNFV